MYPDMDRDHIINAGNSSLEGAAKLLLNRALLKDIDQILEEMVYIQFAEVEDFLELMVSSAGIASYGFPALSHCYEENTGAAGKKRKCDFYKE